MFATEHLAIEQHGDGLVMLWDCVAANGLENRKNGFKKIPTNSASKHKSTCKMKAKVETLRQMDHNPKLT